MGKIRRLDQYLIDRIAAGEVVQRPLNVVKELMENSIDAGATAMTVEIVDGGVKKIRVTDNGSGMDKDDAVLAIQRHATSKISHFEDLNVIGTLGFRGEALSAIAAVSKMEIMTQSETDDIGIKLAVDGGVLQQKSYIGMANGTTILVQNLFYNTPARLKFLKSHGAEGAAVSDIVSRFILAYPDIAIQYISNDKTMMQSFGNGRLESAAMAIYGADLKEKTLKVNYESGDIRITGLIGTPQYAFKHRKVQSLFINGRYILSDRLTKTIAKAYDAWLVPGLFPFYVLSIALPFDETDVNVHPNKLTIKFKDEQALDLALTEAVSFTLGRVSSLPKIKLSDNETPKQETVQQVFEPLKTKQETSETDSADKNLSDILDALFMDTEPPAKKVASPDELDQAVFSEQNFALSVGYIPPKQENVSTEEKTTEEPKIAPELKFIGSFKNAYLLAESGTDLLLVDQHAAHERMIFDRLMAYYKARNPRSQVMLIPESLKVSAEEFELLKDHQDELSHLGFKFILNDGLSVVFTALPSDLTDLSLETLLDDIYSVMGENKGTEKEIEALIMKSCKKAVKAGNVLPFAEAKYLIETFILTGHMPTCPHGRPIIAILSQKELEKAFRRTV